ncbi:hypothetical protein C6Y14_11915 [Streptomyces dioscori]|uniref:Uncharacterized protein n=1 Tax=Streptomyces dioscori TaxID=2109333 RepID=A0A2P8Q9G1_9ACTN|nr:hypothetical protein C6Y14_11915 [Streptomyces dioscori]
MLVELHDDRVVEERATIGAGQQSGFASRADTSSVRRNTICSGLNGVAAAALAAGPRRFSVVEQWALADVCASEDSGVQHEGAFVGNFLQGLVMILRSSWTSSGGGSGASATCTQR